MTMTRFDATMVRTAAVLVVAATFVIPTCYSFSPIGFLSRLVPGARAKRREGVVEKYFDGVNKQDPEQIASCFSPTTTIRDVCGVNPVEKNATPRELADRCMEFLAAHPDTRVYFHYGPACSRNSRWVIAHWYELGTWSGESCGIKPNNKDMAVEGQTRFHVSDDFLITDMVVTRTFSEWEILMLSQKQTAEGTARK